MVRWAGADWLGCVQRRLREEAAEAVVLAEEIFDHLPELKIAGAGLVEEVRALLARQVESFSEEMLGGFLELVQSALPWSRFRTGKRGFHSSMQATGVRGLVSGGAWTFLGYDRPSVGQRLEEPA